MKESAEDRGLRGGNWNNTANDIESSNRNNNNPTNENNDIGFRVAGPWTRRAVAKAAGPLRP
jgi:formylglycine-generating enzyme required for sulfatase activity